MLAKDLAAYRNGVHCMKLQDDSTEKDKIKRGFMNVLFHNKVCGHGEIGHIINIINYADLWSWRNF